MPETDSSGNLTRKPPMRTLVALFGVSGATSLVYESLWARQLYLVVGTTQLAICIVLASFMTGLAVGGLLSARFAGRIERPLIAFAILEAFVAAYALIFSSLTEPATHLYLSLSAALPPHQTTMITSQFVVLWLLLLPPTLCMGATLPLLTRFANANSERAGAMVGRLYGVNTLGAVFGTALAGFALLPLLGLAATTWVAALANLAVALGATWIARGCPSTPTRTMVSRRVSNGRVSPLLLLAALGGFASLVCEVAWFRLLTLLLGGSAYSFTIMLLAFLLGIGAGGWAGGRLADRALATGGRPRVLLCIGGMQLGVATACWAAMFAYGELPYAYAQLYWLIGGAPVLLFAAKLSIALVVMLIPALLMGASFPFLVRAAADDDVTLDQADVTLDQAVGWVYGANTVGAILGASIGGLLLVPTLQIQGAVAAAASINLVAMGLAFAWSRAWPKRALAGLSLATAASVVLVHWARPPWDPLVMSSGMYQYASELPRTTREGFRYFAVDRFDLLHYEEGLSAVVTVARSRADRNVWLANNGKVDASTRSDLDTQVLLAHLPAIVHPNSKRALVIGLASGITAGSLLLDDRIDSLHIAELEPAVLRASHYFDEVNNRPLEDPRVRVFLNDARNHLLRAPDGYYDLVISEPSNPWLTGAASLFTSEFYRMGKRKLAQGGAWAQWIQMYDMENDDLRSLLATFASYFSQVAVFRVGTSDLVVVGSDTELQLDASRIDQYVREVSGVMDDLNRIEIQRAEDLIALYLVDRAEVMALAEGIELNTDDNLRIEYSAPLHLFTDTGMRNVLMLEEVARVPHERLTPGRLPKLAYAYAERDGGWKRALEALRLAMQFRPDDPAIASMHEQYLALARPPPVPVRN